MLKIHIPFICCVAFIAGSASALEPEQVFRQAAPSVTMVFAMSGKTRLQGSGVVVSPEQVVTNCHVVLDTTNKPLSKLRVRQIDREWPATFVAGDKGYDTCLLSVPGLIAPPIKIANLNTLRIGQRVYAIGAPSGLELTLTDGLLSGLRRLANSRVIQTSAAISPGSSGGGLFDDEARLIGITSFGKQGTAGLNFAYYADAIISLVNLSAVDIGDKAIDTTVKAALTKAVSDNRHRTISFNSLQAQVNWLSVMSPKLERKIRDANESEDFLLSVHYEATRAGLDPQLVLGLIEVASGFNRRKVSSGAQGYMQIQPAWINLVGSYGDSLFDLKTNLRFGCTILRHYLDLEKGDLFHALARYEVAMRRGPGQEQEPSDGTFPNRVRAAWLNRWALN